MSAVDSRKQFVLDWVADHATELSDWHQIIWQFAEPAFREYKSSAWYVAKLRELGFEVEAGSGGMPTAFMATWKNGAGPTIATYVEYDAVPGNCQAASTKQEPRKGLSKYAPGHTDPHSALGMGAFAGALATKAAMEKFGIKGTLKVFGEPAEKVRASKPIHAAKGYYDDLDAAVSFHPAYMLPMCNTTIWNTHCGVGYNYIYTFTCDNPQDWIASDKYSPIPQNHLAARAPGASDALMHFYSLNESLRRSMLPFTGLWSFNEAILCAGQATADNLTPQISQIDYMLRTDSIERRRSSATSWTTMRKPRRRPPSANGRRPGWQRAGRALPTMRSPRRPMTTSLLSAHRNGKARRSAWRRRCSAISASIQWRSRSCRRPKA